MLYEDLPSPETIVSTGMKDVCEMLAKGWALRGSDKSLGYASIRTVQREMMTMTMAPSPISPGEFQKAKAKSGPFQRPAWHGMERRGRKGGHCTGTAPCQPRKHGSRHFENRKTGRGRRSRAFPFPSLPGETSRKLYLYMSVRIRGGASTVKKLDTNPILTWHLARLGLADLDLLTC